MCWTQSRLPWLVAVGLLLHYFSVSTCSVQHFLIWYDSTKSCENHSSPGTFWNFNDSSAVSLTVVLWQLACTRASFYWSTEIELLFIFRWDADCQLGFSSKFVWNSCFQNFDRREREREVERGVSHYKWDQTSSENWEYHLGLSSPLPVAFVFFAKIFPCLFSLNVCLWHFCPFSDIAQTITFTSGYNIMVIIPDSNFNHPASPDHSFHEHSSGSVPTPNTERITTMSTI